MWINVKNELPPTGEEVLVLVDEHRGPAWRNNFALVAYHSITGKWWEEQHPENPVIGVTHWSKITYPE